MQAGASVRAGTWPPMLNIFTKSMERGKFDLSLPGGGEIRFEKIHPMDATFDMPEDVPEEIREDKRYRELSGYTIQEVATPSGTNSGRVAWTSWSMPGKWPRSTEAARGNQPGRISAAVSASAYSMVSLVQRFGPLMREGARWSRSRISRASAWFPAMGEA